MSSTTKLLLVAGAAYFFFRDKPAPKPKDEPSPTPAKADKPKQTPKSDAPKKATVAAVKTGPAPRFLKGEYKEAFERVAAHIGKGEPLLVNDVDDLILIDSATTDAEFSKVLEALNLRELEYKQLVLIRKLAP